LVKEIHIISLACLWEGYEPSFSVLLASMNQIFKAVSLNVSGT
jgi:hypothetical protein